MTRKCQKCGCTTFYVTAHVTQGWIVDGEGNWLETTASCEEVTHAPDDQDVWQCAKCGEEWDGKTYGEADPEDICEVVLHVSGTHSFSIPKASKEEMLKSATAEYENADYGALRDIEMEVVSIEDENGKTLLP